MTDLGFETTPNTSPEKLAAFLKAVEVGLRLAWLNLALNLRKKDLEQFEKFN
jgi:hypothetical protein